MHRSATSKYETTTHGVRPVDKGGGVLDGPVGVGVLDQGPAVVLVGEVHLLRVAHLQTKKIREGSMPCRSTA